MCNMRLLQNLFYTDHTKVLSYIIHQCIDIEIQKILVFHVTELSFR